MFGVASLAVVGGGSEHPGFIRAPFSAAGEVAEVRASASSVAFGKSGGLKMHVAMPGATMEFPLAVSGDPSALRYQWLALDSSAADSVRPLAGALLVAPTRPGFYRLALLRGDTREVLPEPTLGVLVPFDEKRGSLLNGYRIGTYLSERLGHAGGRPAGFLEVSQAEARLRVSQHLTIADFITRDDQQDVWPKYVALSPQLLDKIELVIDEVQRWRLQAAGQEVANLRFGVSSGFRAPAHNARVRRAASDSRHQYGDAADVVMDADGDGRITAMDGKLVALAVEMVEMRNPELVGGLGLYTSRRYRTPYVHIDARGRRSRWGG
jgi:uncharacterized protein YcbK (DUF882 family)